MIIDLLISLLVGCAMAVAVGILTLSESNAVLAWVLTSSVCFAFSTFLRGKVGAR